MERLPQLRRSLVHRLQIGSTSTVSNDVIAVGSIDLDMFNSVNQQLVWRGIVSKSLDPGATPEKQKKSIDAAAAKLLKNYPPGKK